MRNMNMIDENVTRTIVLIIVVAIVRQISWHKILKGSNSMTKTIVTIIFVAIASWTCHVGWYLAVFVTKEEQW